MLRFVHHGKMLGKSVNVYCIIVLSWGDLISAVFSIQFVLKEPPELHFPEYKKHFYSLGGHSSLLDKLNIVPCLDKTWDKSI